MKNLNNTLFGFDSMHDFLTSLISFRYKTFTLSITGLSALAGFISQYVYNDYKAVFFLMFLIMFDTATGIYRAFKTKTFTSKRLPRMLLIMVTYCLLLATGWQASLYSHLFGFLPSLLYGWFIATLLTSVIENLSAVGLLPEPISRLLEEKLNFKNLVKKDENNSNG